eukprot:6173276-Pleurochrysis_carterae.AAC.4
MDGNKNRCPSFVRNPKAAHEQLKDAMTFYVVGVIFHGKPDTPHIFPATPQLAGIQQQPELRMFHARRLPAILKLGDAADAACAGMLRMRANRKSTTTFTAPARVVSILTHVNFVCFACAQLDNASDNKSRWVLGFFAWLVKLGWVKEVRISMMMVGHTHEDIDALFRRIAEYWARKGKVGTPSAFQRYLRAAVPGAVVHDLVEYVHDFKSFFTDHIYDNVQGINDAREFIIRERDDGVVAFWYKPCSSHKHTYPAMKDEDGNPVRTDSETVTVDGEAHYKGWPTGIASAGAFCHQREQ